MILIIDNYDSFTYNLYQYLGTLKQDIRVVRNDALTVEEVRALKPSHLILSPGPGKPENAGICEEVLRQMQGELPILGVCLGHQAIGEVFGGKVILAPELVHGKPDNIILKRDNPLFRGLPAVIKAARYHSLIVDKDSLPETLEVIGETEKQEIMALKHRQYPIYGVQFHPESIMTEQGMNILKNFLTISGGEAND